MEIKKATRHKSGKVTNLEGQKIFRLKVDKFIGSINGHSSYHVTCDCGKKLVMRGTGLLSGKTKSCGCYRAEYMSKAGYIHGHATVKVKTETYKRWRAMFTRVNHKDDGTRYFRNYAGKGITVCERWKDYRNFLEDMGEGPAGLELDRIDNSKGYFKENCRWVTRAENQRNKTNTFWVEYNGKKQCAKDWSVELGLHYATLLHRLKHGWTIEQAFTKKPKYNKAPVCH